MSFDQFWSIFAMPIGLLLCFGPVIVAWLVAEARRKPEREDASPPPTPRSQKH